MVNKPSVFEPLKFYCNWRLLLVNFAILMVNVQRGKHKANTIVPHNITEVQIKRVSDRINRSI